MKRGILILLILSVIFSCTSNDKLKIDVSNIKSDVSIKRFEKVFYTAKPSDLPEIKKEFRYFFHHDVDSIWVNKMQDKEEQELFKETLKVYPNLDEVKNNLDNLFKHVKYYYPKFKEPTVITLNSNVSFEQKVVYNDDLLFISLDVFLGSDNKIYETYPEYLKQNFTKKQLTVSVAKELIKSIIFKSTDRTFISKIIQEGKKMYALDAFLPNFDDANKISYTTNKIKWAEANEYMIWSYFVEKELLYSTGNELSKRFIDEAPFSKFYLDIDNESPGRIGVWLGWQIVKSYMKHNNELTLTDLLATDNQLIFKKSKYKPSR